MKTRTLYIVIFLFSILFISCESELERQKRIADENQQRIELEERKRQAEIELALKEEEERKEKAIFDQYINNSLNNGSSPYAYCYGYNGSCSDWGCSEINVKTPYNSDVLVTIKDGDKVVRHAYIQSGESYTFELSNGTYQPFFYYGKGWNPNKIMKESSCGTIKGGFISNEDIGKDSPQKLSNNILEYELILQQNGNFSTRPSDANEAF